MSSSDEDALQAAQDVCEYLLQPASVAFPIGLKKLQVEL